MRRIPPEGDTAGWCLRASGGMSLDPDFVVPLHVAELGNWRVGLLRYLGLPLGWRFLADPGAGCEDVWKDPRLLEEAEAPK